MTPPALLLQAQKRNLMGRKVKTLRREGMLPANIFGKKIKSVAIQVMMQDFSKVYEEAGETNLISLKVANEKQARPVLATNLQKDPVTDTVIHVDFREVDLSQKVTVAVPIEIVGESPAVKEKGAVLLRLLDEIEVEALPKDLPDKITIDISGLTEFDQGITVKDLKVAKEVAVLADPQESVVMVQEPKKEEEAPPAVAPAEAVPVAEAAATEEEKDRKPKDSGKEGDQDESQ